MRREWEVRGGFYEGLTCVFLWVLYLWCPSTRLAFYYTQRAAFCFERRYKTTWTTPNF